MTKLKITERRKDFITILDLEGKIRLGEGTSDLHKSIRNLVENGQNNILLNLDNVSHIDSSGLGELVGGYTTLRKAGGELKLIHLSDRVHELITMTKLLTVFDIYDDETKALESFDHKTAKSAYADSIM